MESAGSKGGSGPEQAAFAAAMERFGQVLRTILLEIPAEAAASVNNQSLARRLAVELDRWLRDPVSMPPWWRNLQTAPSFVASPSERLVARWFQLQSRLAMHWDEVARSASERFTARVATTSAPLDLRNIYKLYHCWIECAEQAYAATVHTDDFCRTQAELVNLSITFLLEQRGQVERFATVLGLATRSEVDALRRKVERMRSEPLMGSDPSASNRRRRKARRS